MEPAENDAAQPPRVSQLERLESEAIHILREAVAEARNPVMLFSAGKDSTVMAHLALRAYYPSKPPFPLLHIDSTWEFGSLLAFRDAFARDHGFDLIVRANEEGRASGLNPFDHGECYARSPQPKENASHQTRDDRPGTPRQKPVPGLRSARACGDRATSRPAMFLVRRADAAHQDRRSVMRRLRLAGRARRRGRRGRPRALRGV